jgi:hypothetical protein
VAHRKDINVGLAKRRFPAILARIHYCRHLCRSYTRAPKVASISYAPTRIFVFNSSREPLGSLNMLYDLTSNDKFRGPSYEGNEAKLCRYGLHAAARRVAMGARH